MTRSKEEVETLYKTDKVRAGRRLWWMDKSAKHQTLKLYVSFNVLILSLTIGGFDIDKKGKDFWIFCGILSITISRWQNVKSFHILHVLCSD